MLRVCARSSPAGYSVDHWAEHLGLPADDPRLADVTGAMALWTERLGADGSRIRHHVPPRLSARTRSWARPAYGALYDPDGRPLRLRGTTRF